MNFLFGGISGCLATCFIQPIIYLKVQIQVRSEQGIKQLNPINIAKEIYAKEGTVKAFYKGLDPALLRQVVYTSTRLGLFYTLTDKYKKKHNKSAPCHTIIFYSLICGAIGSIFGNPADVALIRMQTDVTLPDVEKRNYKNVFHAFNRIVREEGILTLWRGSGPTVVRAMAVNFSLLVPFEETKKLSKNLIHSEKKRSIAASLVAGGFACFLSLPFDNIKVKLQKMNKNKVGLLPYNGVRDCLIKTVKKEGAAKLWVGLGTYYLGIAPYAIISLVSNDFLRSLVTNKK